MPDYPRPTNHLPPPTNNLPESVAALVGPGGRVLLLGWGAAALEPGLQAHGGTVVRLAEAEPGGYTDHAVAAALDGLPGEPFDAVVAVGLLEQLKDPLAVLKRLRACLRDEGRLVAVVPNIAHGSLRLALLAGHFPLSEAGWGAAAPVRFFTRASLERLLEEAGLLVDQVERTTRPFGLDDAPVPPDLLPPGLLDSLRQDPDALADQFIVVARAVSRADWEGVQARLRAAAQARETAALRVQALEESLAAAQARVQALEAERSALQRENQALQARLAEQAADLESLTRQVVLSPQREVALRQRLLEAHDELLERDEELVKLRQAADNAAETVRWMQASRSWQMIQKTWAWREQARRLLKPGSDKP